MSARPKILAFAGSLREYSYSKRVLKTAMKGAELAGAEVTFVDLRDYPMPIYNPDAHVNVLPAEVAVSFAENRFDGDEEQMKDEKMGTTLENLGASLVEMLKRTRSEIELVSSNSN